MIYQSQIQRATFHTSARATIHAPSIASASATSSNMSTSVSRFGRGTKWSVVAATTIALSAAAAVELRSKQPVKAPKGQSYTEAEKRYQSLIEAMGSGESIEDLQKAVGMYESDSTSSTRSSST